MWDEPFIGNLTKQNISSITLNTIYGSAPQLPGEMYVVIITDIVDNKFDVCLERVKDYSLTIKDIYEVAREISKNSGQTIKFGCLKIVNEYYDEHAYRNPKELGYGPYIEHLKSTTIQFVIR